MQATLEGLNDRLLQQFVDQIDAGVRSRVINESDIRRAFLAEYSRANLDQSIRVHEGRHAIDEALAGHATHIEVTLQAGDTAGGTVAPRGSGLIATALHGIVAQRLVRQVCPASPGAKDRQPE